MKIRLYATELWTLFKSLRFHLNRNVVGASPAAGVMTHLLKRNAFHEPFNLNASWCIHPSTPEAHETCIKGTGAIADGRRSAQRHFGPATEVVGCSITLYSTLINETFAADKFQ